MNEKAKEGTATTVRNYVQRLLADPTRPLYHFAAYDANDMHPGDANGAFFADGVYHLMYLYKNAETRRWHWGHVTSIDLLHWRQHRDALVGPEDTFGCFSGGAFLDDDGTAYLSYWQLQTTSDPSDKDYRPGGIAIASSRPPYEEWTEWEPVIPATSYGVVDVTVNGKVMHAGCSDPTNIWKIGGVYYMQTGALPVMERYGRAADSPKEYRGDWTELFRSTDLKKWEYVHRFYDRMTGDDVPDDSEDDMCPSFLPLYDAPSGGKRTDKWLQLFIAHNRGCQYYVGTLDGEKFLPEVHGRMSWKDNYYFAPEALIDDKRRQIMWVWLLDDAPSTAGQEWNGIYSFPRVVWWQDGALHMAPAEELDRLQLGHRNFDGLKAGSAVDVKNGESFRIKAVFDASAAGARPGFKVRVSDDGKEFTAIYYDAASKKLVVDATASGCRGWMVKEEAPFELAAGEEIRFDVFVDRSVVEVYVNERQAICRRVYPTDPTRSKGVELIGTAAPKKLDTWEMAPSNNY